MQGLELKLHKDRFENAVKFLTLRGYDIKVEKDTFCISKNGWINRAKTELKLIILAENCSFFNTIKYENIK